MSNSAFFAVWFFVPFLSGLGLTVLLHVWLRRGGLWAALTGVVLAVSVVLLAYFSAPRTYPQGTETELYLGRYWEPQFVGFIVAGGFVFWLMGVGAGIALASLARHLIALARDRRKAHGAP